MTVRDKIEAIITDRTQAIPGTTGAVAGITEAVDALMAQMVDLLTELAGERRPVTQDWVHAIPLMQQTVLLTAVRGPDGLPKYHPVKYLLRWYRRCVLLSAMDQRRLTDPWEPNGGSFTGPSLDADEDVDIEDWEPGMDSIVGEYLKSLDEVPLHAHLHFLHAVEIVGYKHDVDRIRRWWRGVYERLVNDLHLNSESEAELDARLGDTREGWLARNDPATAT